MQIKKITIEWLKKSSGWSTTPKILTDIEAIPIFDHIEIKTKILYKIIGRLYFCATFLSRIHKSKF